MKKDRQEVIQLKSPILLKLDINVGFGECYSETFKLGFLVFSTSSLVVGIRYCPLYCL